MTHGDILKKFFIEYDKDMITSSYPSLTINEACNFLNKAYFAIIGQKFSGNNLRQVPFEGDTKQLEDLQELVITTEIDKYNLYTTPKNKVNFENPVDMLYYVNAILKYNNNIENVILVPHAIAKNFIHTDNNMPWIENPVCVIQDNKINIFYDDYKHNKVTNTGYFKLLLTYIKNPILFAPNSLTTEFELNDSVVEELINLAITFVLNTVESSRLTANTNLLKLES